jgi:hypothetical protein
MSPENVLITLTFSAAFVYLTTRLVALVWGVPRLSSRLKSMLELQKTPPQLSRPAGSLDVWALLVLLFILEVVLMRMLADALSSGDSTGTALVASHFLFAFAWVIYLLRIRP